MDKPTKNDRASRLPSYDDTFYRELLPSLLDLGSEMVVVGADIGQVERTLSRLGCAYGIASMNVFAITEMILVTVTLPSGHEHTVSRRIEVATSIDFKKLAELSQLCQLCCKDPMSPKELQERSQAIAAKPMDDLALYGGGALSCGAFAVFFGGNAIDGIVAALVGLFICFTLRRWRGFFPNTLVFDFAVAFLAGIMVGVVALLIPDLSTDKVTAGVIMVLIPGVAMTNALRDLIAGDTLSGVLRLVESLLWAVALALGFMAAMLLCTQLGGVLWTSM